MLTREFKIRSNKKWTKAMREHLWVLTGVYNWAIRQIEFELKDCSKKLDVNNKTLCHKLPKDGSKNINRLKYVDVNVSEFGLYDRVSGCAKKMRSGVSNEAILSMIYQARNAWDRCLKLDAGRPKLKGVRNRLNGFSFFGDCKIDLKNGIAKLPKLGKVKFKTYNYGDHLKGSKLSAHVTIKHRADGWYLVVRLDGSHVQALDNTVNAIGIDPGLKDLVVTSEGEKIEKPRELENAETQIGRIQRGMSGKRRNRSSKKLARAHLKVARQRKDRNHKISHKLIKENKEIYWSDDNYNVLKKKFGKSVSSGAPGMLREFLTYKGSSCDRKFNLVSNKYSTQTCSNCGVLSGPKGLAGLVVRTWSCTCGKWHDRDINAAINTLKFGLGSSLDKTVTPSGETAEKVG